MKTAVITDGKYRSSLAAVRELGKAGYRVVVTQTRQDSKLPPAPFDSVYTDEHFWIEGSCKDAEYGDRLLALLKQFDHPVLLCTGAVTLNTVSRRREEFARYADFLVSAPEVLDALNDKEQVHQRAKELGIPVPAEYDGIPGRFPVVIKPHCGEKAGLKARDRYAIASNPEEFKACIASMEQFDPNPIVQEKIVGAGEGANLLLDRDSRLICAMCHRRIREFPASGGPSTCCESFYDEEMIRSAYRLLASFCFTGMAMVEFKGGKILEVNPRVWGSFPMTVCCQSRYTELYAAAAQGQTVQYHAGGYRSGTRMRFLFNDGAATLDYLRRGRFGKAIGGVLDLFRVREALYDKDDRHAYRSYLRNSLRDR